MILSQSKLNWKKPIPNLEDEEGKKIEMFLTGETIAVALLLCSELIPCYLEYYEHEMNIVESHVWPNIRTYTWKNIRFHCRYIKILVWKNKKTLYKSCEINFKNSNDFQVTTENIIQSCHGNIKENVKINKTVEFIIIIWSKQCELPTPNSLIGIGLHAHKSFPRI